MESGAVPDIGSSSMTRKESSSNTVTVLLRLLLVKPRFKPGANATPRTPGVWGMLPASRPLKVSSTSTWSSRVMKRRAPLPSTAMLSQPADPPTRQLRATV